MKYLFFTFLFCSAAIAENRIKIAVVDTGVPQLAEVSPYLCKDNDYTIPDTEGHATFIAKIFQEEGLDSKKYCLLFRGASVNKNGRFNVNELFSEIAKLLEYNVKYVNLSFSGGGHYKQEQQIYELMLRKGVKFYVAAGNDNENLDNRCATYPACYIFSLNNWNVIGALDNSGFKLKTSNYGSIVTKYENGIKCLNTGCEAGTSFAAPRALLKDLH